MSLRQDIFIQELPKNDYNLTKTAKKVGYSESYAEKTIHHSIGKYRGWQEKLKSIYSEEGIKREQAKALKDFKKVKDNTNRQRAIEFMGKIAGVVIDKSENKNLNVNEEKKAEIHNHYVELLKKRNLDIIPLSITPLSIES